MKATSTPTRMFLFIGSVLAILTILSLAWGQGVIASILGYSVIVEPKFLQEEQKDFIFVASYNPGDFEVLRKINAHHEITLGTNYISVKPLTLAFKEPATDEYFMIPSSCSIITNTIKTEKLGSTIKISKKDCEITISKIEGE